MGNTNFNSPEYLDWLHKLTVAGYERNITISADHQDAIQAIYLLKNDESIGKCLNRYIAFCKRWEALHQVGGDFFQLDPNDTEKKPYARIDWENCHFDYDHTICPLYEVGAQLEAMTMDVEDLDEPGYQLWKEKGYLPTATISIVMLTTEEWHKHLQSWDK